MTFDLKKISIFLKNWIFFSNCSYTKKLVLHIHALSSYKDHLYKDYVCMYWTFHNLRTTSTGFGKIKDQKMDIVFILIRNFEWLYLSHNIIDFETTKLVFSYPWILGILGILRIFHFFPIVTNIYEKKEQEK